MRDSDEELSYVRIRLVENKVMRVVLCSESSALTSTRSSLVALLSTGFFIPGKISGSFSGCPWALLFRDKTFFHEFSGLVYLGSHPMGGVVHGSRPRGE